MSAVVSQALGDRYERGVRAAFRLTPGELATLAAIATYVETHGAPMPRAVLERAAANPDLQGFYAVDLATPGRLFREDLIRLVGYREERSYDVTALGRERLAS